MLPLNSIIFSLFLLYFHVVLKPLSESRIEKQFYLLIAPIVLSYCFETIVLKLLSGSRIEKQFQQLIVVF
jgi:hypothetical protein